MNAPHPAAPAERIAVIGAGRRGPGRLAAALAAALREAGFDVTGPHAREAEAPEADVVLLCVPDSAIAEAARASRGRAGRVGHVSGATTLADVDFSIHPLQTFTGTESPAAFHGIGAAIAGRTDADRQLATRLAEALGAWPFEVDDAHRAGYHAAASFASNFVLTVLDAAGRLIEASGMRPDEARELLAPLAAQSVENWRRQGADALTGPIARGDEATVARQRAAVAGTAPALAALFDELSTATRDVARRGAAGSGIDRGITDRGITNRRLGDRRAADRRATDHRTADSSAVAHSTADRSATAHSTVTRRLTDREIA